MESKVIILDKNRLFEIFYWFIPLILFLFQLIFTYNSMNQIRYEELAESVRNVFWLNNRLIYDGISSNIGWYGTLLFIYKLFGFSLNSAKVYRLLVHFISLVCIAAIFKKYFGVKKSIVPLITVGISPTLLYFNILQTSYGIDLQYLPISVFFLLLIRRNSSKITFLPDIFFWSFNMIAWMSYPTYLYYLPVLISMYFLILMKQYKKNIQMVITKSVISVIAFILPLFFGYLYLSNRNILFYDPVEKSGIFRGAGILNININVSVYNIIHVLADLFSTGNSYYFEFIKGEFSDFYPILTIIFISVFSIIICKTDKKYGIIRLFALVIFFLNIFISNFTIDPTTHPGIRRNTAIIAVFYILFALTWNYINEKKWKNYRLGYFFTLIMIIIPLHHLIIFPNNVMLLKKPSYYKESVWFSISENPNNSLETLATQLTKSDLPLRCFDQEGETVSCRYSEIFSALSGYCLWNNLKCNKISGYDQKSGKYITLSTTLWGNYYFLH
jgi:hypothetical protein